MDEKNALIFAADIGSERILQAFKIAMPKAVIALIIGSNGVESVEEVKDKAGWMIDSFDSIELDRDFDLVLDSTREHIERYRELGYKVYVSISSTFPEISAALYAATMFKEAIPIAPEAQNPKLPMLRILMLPRISLYILQVLYEDFNGSATLTDLAEGVIKKLEEELGKKRKSGNTLINYHVNRRLKPLGLVRTRIEKKELRVELTNAGLSAAKRIEDYKKFLETPAKEKKEEKEKIVIGR